MPAPRVPRDKLMAKGSMIKNPKLFAGRTEPSVTPLGKPSPHLNAMQRTAWVAFQSEIPWLAESDRAIMEVACHVRAKLLEGMDMPMAALTVLRQCLSCMGATPADRSRIVVRDEDEPADPAAEFFN